jgi:hypothetical protein
MDALLAELKALRTEVCRLKEKVSAPMAGKLTVLQVAHRLGCSRTKVFEYLESGELSRAPSHGRATMVTLASVEALEAPQGAAIPRPVAPAAPRAFNLEEEEAKFEALLSRRRGQNGDVISRTQADTLGRSKGRKRAKSPLER